MSCFLKEERVQYHGVLQSRTFLCLFYKFIKIFSSCLISFLIKKKKWSESNSYRGWERGLTTFHFRGFQTSIFFLFSERKCLQIHNYRSTMNDVISKMETVITSQKEETNNINKYILLAITYKPKHERLFEMDLAKT